MATAKFQMPDGKIATFEVPDGTTPEAATSMVHKYLQEQSEPERDYTMGELTSKAFMRGARGIQSTITDVIPAMVGSALGADEYAKKQLEEARQYQAETAKKYGAQYKTSEEAKTLGDKLKFALETGVEQVPNLATMLTPAGVGRAAAGKLAERALLKGALAEAGEAGLTAEARQALLKSAAPELLAKRELGQDVGLYLGSYSQNAPEVFQSIYENTGELRPAAGAIYGAASAAFDSAMPSYLLKRFTGAEKVAIVSKILEKSGMKPSLLRSVLATVPEATALEGLTEGAQEAINIAAEKFVTKNQDKFTSDQWNRIMEASIKGGVAGGLFGGFAAIPERFHERRQEQLQQAIKDLSQTAAAPTTPPADVTGVQQDGNIQPITEGPREGVQVPGQPLAGAVSPDVAAPIGPGVAGATTDTGAAQVRTEGGTAPEAGSLDQIRSVLDKIDTGVKPTDIRAELSQIATDHGIQVSSALSSQNLVDMLSQKLGPQELALRNIVKEEKFKEPVKPATPEQQTFPGVAPNITDPKVKEARDAWESLSPVKWDKLAPQDQNNIVDAHASDNLNKDLANEIKQQYQAADPSAVKSEHTTEATQNLQDLDLYSAIKEAATLKDALNAIKNTFNAKLTQPQRILLGRLANLKNAANAQFRAYDRPYDEVTRRPEEKGSITKGVYNHENHFIATFKNASIPTVLHEGVHAATHQEIEKHVAFVDHPPERAGFLNTYKITKSHKAKTKLGQEFVNIYDKALEVAIRRGEAKLSKEAREALAQGKETEFTWDRHYGFENMHEFITEAFSNEEFQDFLGSIPSITKNKSKSLWDDFIQAVKKILGIHESADTLLDDILTKSEPLFKGKRGTVSQFASKILGKDKGLYEDVSKSVSAVPPSGYSKPQAQNLINSVGKVYTSLPKFSQSLGTEVRNIVSKTPRWYQKAYLSLLSLPQKIELYGKQLPALKNLLVALEQRASVADQERSKVDKLVFQGKAIIDSFPRAVVDKFNKLTLQLSAEEIDPRNPDNINHPLVRNFHTLPKELQDLAIAYTKQYEAYTEQLIAIMNKYSPEAGGALKKRWMLHKQPFYHPLRRQGEYWLSYKDKTGTDVTMAFKSPAERTDHLRKTPGATDINQFTKLEQRNYKDAPPGEFVSKLIAMLQRDLNEQGLDSTQIDGIINEVYNSYLDLLPAGSIKQQMREREGTPGYIEDVVGGFADVGSKIANQLANLEYRPQINEALNDLVTNLDSFQGDEKTKDTLTNVVQDIYDQRKFLENPVANKYAAQAGFVSYLWNIAGNVSSALVNMTQVPMTVFPMLSGRYGYAKSFRAMENAYKMYFNGKRDNNRVYMPDHTFGMNPNLSKEHKALYDAAIEASAIRRGPGYELSEMRRQNTADFTGKTAKMETWLSWMFQNTERMNREVTLIAAYDLARANGMSETAAIKEALDLTTKAHTHSLSEAGPRLMQDGLPKVMFTFKRFAQAQIYNVGRLFYLATRNMPTEERAIARKQLLGIFGMTYVFAGAQGLPLYGAANMLLSTIAGMFGDDEPFDFDEEIREAIGDLGYKGPINKLLGMDVASRTGFNGMIWRTDERRLAEVGFAPYFAEHFFGPAWQVAVINPGRAAKLFEEGHTERAIEAVVPGFARNLMKGIRFAAEGATNKDGIKIVDDIGVMSSLMQILGFTNAELAEAYTRANVMKKGEKQILDRKAALINVHYLAQQNGDLEMLAKNREDIAAFNKTFPGSITPETLRRSAAQHRTRLQKSVDGVYLNKKYAKYLQEELGA